MPPVTIVLRTGDEVVPLQVDIDEGFQNADGSGLIDRENKNGLRGWRHPPQASLD